MAYSVDVEHPDSSCAAALGCRRQVLVTWRLRRRRPYLLRPAAAKCCIHLAPCSRRMSRMRYTLASAGMKLALGIELGDTRSRCCPETVMSAIDGSCSWHFEWQPRVLTMFPRSIDRFEC